MPVQTPKTDPKEFSEWLIAAGHVVGPSPQYRVSRATAAFVLSVSEKSLRNRAAVGLRPDYYRVLGRVQYGLLELIDVMETRPGELAA